MYKNPLWLILATVFIVSSCDLLGIGGDNDDAEKETGPSLLWKLDTTGGTSGTAPIIDRGKVYVRSFELMKVDLKTGSQEWTTGMLGDYHLPDYMKKMLITDKTVLVGQPDNITAFRKSDGQLVWKTNTGLPSGDTDSLYAEPYLLTQTSDHVFAAREQSLIGLEKSTGNRQIEITLDSVASNQAPEKIIALAGGKDASPLLFAATRYKTDDGSMKGSRIFAIDFQNGNSAWTRSVSEVHDDRTDKAPADLIWADGLLVVLTASEVTALEPNTGNRVWQTSLDEVGAQLLSAGNAIYVGTYMGTVIRLGSTDGTIKWRSQTEDYSFAIVTGRMVWEEGYLYYQKFSNENAGIRIIETENGRTERILGVSDIKDAGLDFWFFGGISVEGSYMVKQTELATYGIKL